MQHGQVLESHWIFRVSAVHTGDIRRLKRVHLVLRLPRRIRSSVAGRIIMRTMQDGQIPR